MNNDTKTPVGTPRTDAEEFASSRYEGEEIPGFDYVSSDFARQLERETLAQQQRIRELTEALQGMLDNAVAAADIEPDGKLVIRCTQKELDGHFGACHDARALLPPMSTPMKSGRPYKRIARMIARDLFTEGGTSKVCDRLEQKHGPLNKEKSGAGWCEGALADRIETILENENSKGNLP